MRVPTLCTVVTIVVLSTAGCTNSTTEPTTSSKAYTGTFIGQLIITTTTTGGNLTTICISTNALSGTLKMTLDQPASDGSVKGSANTTGTLTETAFTASAPCQAQPGSVSLTNAYTVTGTARSLAFSDQSTSTGATPSPGVGSVTCTDRRTFAGALTSGVVSGAMTFSKTCQGSSVVNGVSSVINASGSTTIPVALR